MAAEPTQSFDYIIVGAGSAGCVLANRLTEDAGTSALVLEAGGKPKEMWLEMPMAFFKYDRLPRLNWNFKSEPEPGVGGRVIDVPRGKVLGGSSRINGMVYARGHRLDYDDWAQKGLRGWGYATCCPTSRSPRRAGSARTPITAPPARWRWCGPRATRCSRS
ncbi:MAG: GMC family oxidoreductase N-terminal domain-containing protein [Caulobacteraceae bacterium]